MPLKNSVQTDDMLCIPSLLAAAVLLGSEFSRAEGIIQAQVGYNSFQAGIFFFRFFQSLNINGTHTAILFLLAAVSLIVDTYLAYSFANRLHIYITRFCYDFLWRVIYSSHVFPSFSGLTIFVLQFYGDWPAVNTKILSIVYIHKFILAALVIRPVYSAIY